MWSVGLVYSHCKSPNKTLCVMYGIATDIRRSKGDQWIQGGGVHVAGIILARVWKGTPPLGTLELGSHTHSSHLPNTDGVVLLLLGFSKELCYCSGDDPPLTVISGRASHGVCLSCSSLSKG